MSEPTPIKPIYLPPIEQGQSDYRTYRPLLLPTSKDNVDDGITVLLVNDPQSKHFAASVSVHSGASSDPRVLPGLAHFCEHMCFLGSSAYPQENEYKRYLSQHGGKSNASTSMSHTTYQFDVLAEFAEKALDIFTHFFIGPLFTKSGTGREVHAVDSENSKNLVNDGRRRWQVLKSLAHQDHHFSKFSTGNKLTLPVGVNMHSGESNSSSLDTQPSANSSEDIPTTNTTHPLTQLLKEMDDTYDERDMPEFVRAALLAFHKRHYRPKNMTVVVVGPQSLDTLESWVVPRFSNIPDNSMSEADHEEAQENNCTSEKEDAKWSRIQRLAETLIDEAAKEAPPVTVNVAKDVENNPAFRPELQGGKWPVVVTTKPLQSLRKLVLFFPMPPTWDNPDQSPTRLLSHLFGHEGRGSAFALLQDSGWLSSLSSGSRVSGPDQNLFQIEMSLTEEGEKNWKEVTKVIFAYAKMLADAVELSLTSKEGNKDTNDTCLAHDTLTRIWDEVGQIDRMHFHQTSPGAVYSFASSVAQSISKYGTLKCLSAGSMLNETPDTVPAEQLARYCQRITPENCFIERCSEKAWEEMESSYTNGENNQARESGSFVFGKQTEKWYGIDYYISPVLEEDIQSWKNTNDNSLHLPNPNLFIPRSLDLCPDLPPEAHTQRIDKAIDPPKLVANDSNIGRLWWRLDDRYALPKSSLTLLIRTPTSEHKLRKPEDCADSSMYWEYDSETAMKSNFLTGIFSDAMAQDTYDAHLAGLDWSLSKSSSGYTLSCYGYSDRLSDLGLKLLTEFSGNFVKESYFQTNKDKVIRGLKSYFQSKRADSIALYYRNLLMNWRGDGMEKSLEVAESITMDDVIAQHQSIWKDADLVLECLYTGNVSEKDAKQFFDKASGIIKSRSNTLENSDALRRSCSAWIPGPFERRLPNNEDIELHFQSKNEKEENGAVIVTYQSQIPGFKCKTLSPKESMEQSAAIRLLCAIIKEPFFDQLRTQQQLGYIVSSYFDVNFTSRQPSYFMDNHSASSTVSLPLLTSAVDSIVFYVLSRKEEPQEVTNRIDDFLLNFRSRLEAMDSSEIQGYADSLASSLTKPIRKLSEEAKYHFAKIRHYAPEVLADGSGRSSPDLGWDNPEVIANAIRNLGRDNLLKVFDNLIIKKETGARIVSTVYGKTHPMPKQRGVLKGSSYISTMEDLLTKRSTLIPYDPATRYRQSSFMGSLWRAVGKHKTALHYIATAVAVIGVGAWTITSMKNSSSEKKRIK
ncbi:hypothetical protein HJC23_008360 [Cyclotella cryptica]|uniref:Uncharacterized protein n=1 Tax=Cyclotella cryptica TaxID=29204 RepID=A0ABD3Q4W2_9STRA|eukprot:CCRYP_008653-RA/>CCRYP_008653-RA protein AED:0.03 eAED:0.03 QI:207/1/1/1/1/1/6/250/1250